MLSGSTITSNPSGSGNSQVAFKVDPNVASTSARTGTMTIAGRTFTVTQAGCTYSLGGTGRSVPAGGVQGACLGVGAPAGCAWTMVSHDVVDHHYSGPSGTGNGQVVFSVASNQTTHPANRDPHHPRPDVHRDPSRGSIVALVRPPGKSPYRPIARRTAVSVPAARARPRAVPSRKIARTWLEILGEGRSTCPNRPEEAFEHLDEPPLHRHVAEAPGAVARLELLDRRRVRIECVEVGEDGVALDAAGIGHAQVAGVGEHAHDLPGHDVGGIGQEDGVAQRLAHLRRAVGAGQARRRSGTSASGSTSTAP